MKKQATAETVRLAQKAAKKLCLSMRYVGSLLEAVSGKRIGLLPATHPGLHESRDLINLLMLCRAELNGIAKLLIDADVVTHEQVIKTFADEYAYFTDAKAQMLGVEVTDQGLAFNVDELRRRQAEGN